MLTEIQPLERELSQMTVGLQECKDMLLSCENNMRQIDNRVSILKSEFATKTREAEVLKNELSVATSRSKSAIQLIDQLSGKFFGA